MNDRRCITILAGSKHETTTPRLEAPTSEFSFMLSTRQTARILCHSSDALRSKKFPHFCTSQQARRKLLKWYIVWLITARICRLSWICKVPCSMPCGKARELQCMPTVCASPAASPLDMRRTWHNARRILMTLHRSCTMSRQ